MLTKFSTAVLLGFVLATAAACGGGGGLSDLGGSPLPYTALSTTGHIVPPGTYHFAGAPEDEDILEAFDEVVQPAGGYPPGTEIQVGGIGLRCTSDSATNCSVTVHADDSFTTTGTIAIVGAGTAFPMTPVEKQIADANERARKAEADAEKAKADAAKDAADKVAEAEKAKDDAEAEAAEEKRRADAAEAETERRRKADATERARTAIAGHTATTDPLTALVVGSITHNEPAPVTNPSGPFTTTSTGRSGKWSTTTLTVVQEPTRDFVQIYSDVEAPKREPFATSAYNPGKGVIDGTGTVIGHVDITTAAHSRVATSGSFPRKIGPAEPFTLTDRGEYTVAQRESDNADNDPTNNVIPAEYTGPYRDESRFPQRYAYETSGQLQGAGGRYRCDGDATTDSCTVQNNGGSFTFVGDWDFIPSSGSVQIVVPDAEYMWFGVWARQTVRLASPSAQPTELWRFEAQHGGRPENTVSDLSGATGSATYSGPAFGRYAVYEPDTGESGIGTFTASATLQADFDASPNTVSGTITGFSNDSGWSLALKRGDISGGTVGISTNGVTWTIDGVPDDSGAWEGQFYNNLPATTVTYQPHGIAGTFEAAYDPSGVGARAALTGAFGAHRPSQ